MKVGIWLSKSFLPEEGGGFSYYDILINAIDKHVFIDTDVAFISKDGPIKGLQKEVICIPRNVYIIFEMLKTISHVLPNKISVKYDIILEKLLTPYLISKGVKVLFYPTQNDAIVSNFPFISNNWDIGHRSTFAFPELIQKGQFAKRERWYVGKLLKALLVFCESDAGKKELIHFTGIAEEKVKVVPTFSGRSVLTEVSSEEQKIILSKYGLKCNDFFFYPAQFWAHKNHYGLLMGFNEIKKKYNNLKLVFTGSDKDNLNYVKKVVQQLGLGQNVVFCGFVSNTELGTLYRNALALVMTTFFGPTNMPLLEALALNCPVLCSDLEGHREMLKDAALYFSPTKHNEIAECMEKILISKNREELQLKANKVQNESKFNIEFAIYEIEKHFSDLKNIRCCWE